MRAFWPELKRYAHALWQAPLLKLLEALLELQVPLIVAVILDAALQGDRALVNRKTLLLVLIAIVSLGFALLAQKKAANASFYFGRDIKQKLFARVFHSDLLAVQAIGSSEFVTRLSFDVEAVETGLNLFLRLFLRSPFIVLGVFVLALRIDRQIGLWIGAGLLLLFLLVLIILRYSLKRQRVAQQTLSELLRQTREKVLNLKVIRSYVREDEELAIYRKENRLVTKAQEALMRLNVLTNPLSFFLLNAIILLTLYLGGQKVDAGTLPDTDLVALYQLLLIVLFEVIKFASLLLSLARALVSAGRLAAILELPEAADLDLPAALTATGTIPVKETTERGLHLENLGFHYPDADPMFEDLTLSVLPGETLYVLGGTAAGKSTFLKMLAGLYPPTSGTLTFQLQTLSYLAQKPKLFTGTLRENLLLERAEATDEAMWEALEAAQAKDFVARKNKGLDLSVERGGRNFSGGQKQRLAMARVFLKDADLLLLDDPFSALDAVTGANLKRALAARAQDKVTVLISQRASAAGEDDKVLYLEAGKPALYGTFRELMREPRFAAFVESQAKEGAIPSAKGTKEVMA